MEVSPYNNLNLLLVQVNKENSIEFLLDSAHYLYIFVTLTPVYYPVFPYELFLICMSKNNIKEKKKKKNK